MSNVRWSRATGVVWTVVEPLPGTGNYNWRDLDTLVRSAQTGGMNRVFALKSGNGASFSEPGCLRRVESAAPAGLLPDGQRLASCPIKTEMESAWSRMATELVERYDGDGNRDMPGLNRGIRVDIEVENEAVMQQYWDHVEDLFPSAKLFVDHSVASGGYYCQVVGREALSADEVALLKVHMYELIEA